jgi:hypothetical protein
MHIGDAGLVTLQILLSAGLRSWAVDLWPAAVTLPARCTGRARARLRRVVTVAGQRPVTRWRRAAFGITGTLSLPLLVSEPPLEFGWICALLVLARVSRALNSVEVGGSTSSRK